MKKGGKVLHHNKKKISRVVSKRNAVCVVRRDEIDEIDQARAHTTGEGRQADLMSSIAEGEQINFLVFFFFSCSCSLSS